jgi:hypothetical protein
MPLIGIGSGAHSPGLGRTPLMRAWKMNLILLTTSVEIISKSGQYTDENRRARTCPHLVVFNHKCCQA